MKRSSTTMKSLLSILGFICLLEADRCVAHISSNNNQQQQQQQRHLKQPQYSNSEDTEGFSPQLSIDSFAVKFGPTPESPEDEDLLQSIIEDSIAAFVDNNANGLDYLLLTNIQDVSWDSGERRQRRQAVRTLQDGDSVPTTTINFKGGVAAFEDGAPPLTSAELNSIVTAAVQSDQLIAALNEYPRYGSVTGTEYISTAPVIAEDSPPPPPPTNPPIQFTGVNRDDFAESSSDGDKPFNWAAWVGGVLACTFVVVGSAVTAVKIKQARSRRPLEKVGEPIEIDDGATDVDEVMTDDGHAAAAEAEEEDEATAIASGVAQYFAREESIESASVTSSWTMEDSLSTSNLGRRAEDDVWMASEAFNRERQVTLQKDMLHTQWSGIRPQQIGAGTMNAGAPVDGRPPSRRRSRRENRPKALKPADTPFMFAQANSGEKGLRGEGEEIYLMPPSQEARSGRSKTPPPKK